jgi:hypothetical protein
VRLGVGGLRPEELPQRLIGGHAKRPPACDLSHHHEHDQRQQRGENQRKQAERLSRVVSHDAPS